jgi:hypothetical protein
LHIAAAMKHIILAVALILGVEAVAQAQSAEGPFPNERALARYWARQNTSGAATQIFHNGHEVYRRMGFGPAYIVQYFTCADGSGIRSNCSEIFDGFATLGDAMAVVSGLTIYLDGQLIHDASPWYFATLKTCYGDDSYAGPIRYYIVESMYDGFGPPYPGNSCFP